MAICEAITSKVRQRAAGRPVVRVVIRVGHFRQIVPDALEFCWSMVTDATGLEGCKLDIEQVEATVVCDECGAATILDVPILTCGSCGTNKVQLVTGEELMVVSLEMTAV